MKKSHIFSLIRLIYFTFFVLLCSCESKVKTSDIRLGGEHGEEFLYKNKPYTGRIWSMDGKSASIEVSDGRPVKWILFHDNEEPAIVQTDSLGEELMKYYDINGYEMREDEWESKYGGNIKKKEETLFKELYPE